METEEIDFAVTVPDYYENEALRQELAQVKDSLSQAQIMIKFQNEMIVAMRDALAKRDGLIEGDENESVGSNQDLPKEK
jgi:hypothetical protein